MYENVVITLILAVDVYSLWLLRKQAITRERRAMSRRVKRLLQSIGL